MKVKTTAQVLTGLAGSFSFSFKSVLEVHANLHKFQGAVILWLAVVNDGNDGLYCCLMKYHRADSDSYCMAVKVHAGGIVFQQQVLVNRWRWCQTTSIVLGKSSKKKINKWSKKEPINKI